jgi:hypothetical protein
LNVIDEELLILEYLISAPEDWTFIAVGISNLACHLLHEKKIIIKEKVYDVFQQIIIFKQLSTVLYKPMQLSAPSPRLQRSKELVEPLGLYKVRV